jgi:hypothetical protein
MIQQKKIIVICLGQLHYWFTFQTFSHHHDFMIEIIGEHDNDLVEYR